MTLSTTQKAGHVLGIVVAVLNGLPIQPGGSSQKPPAFILVVGAVLGMIVVGLLAWSWKAVRRGPRIAAAALLMIGALMALAGLGADVPAGFKAAIVVTVVLATGATALMFWPADRRSPALR